MSERKGMKQYPEWVKEQVRERIAAGETQKQLSKELGISRYSIQSWCGLRPETKLWQLAGMTSNHHAPYGLGYTRATMA